MTFKAMGLEEVTWGVNMEKESEVLTLRQKSRVGEQEDEPKED